MTKKIITLLLLAFLLCPMCACLNPVSIDNCGYVVAVGADKGEEKEYLVTLELQRESAGTDQENNGGAVILSIEADNLPQAVSKLSSSIAYDLNFTRTHIFVFGSEIARNGLIDEFLKIAFDVFRIRESALMLVAEDKAVDYIGGLASDDAANISKLQDHLISNAERTGKLAAINIARYFEATQGGRFDPVFPIGRVDERIVTDKKQNDNATKGENPLKDVEDEERVGGMQSITEGAALFDGNTMTETLSPYDTQLMNIGRGDFKQGTVEIDLVFGKSASIFLMLSSRKVRIDLSQTQPKVKVDLKLNATVEFDPSGYIGKSWNEGSKVALEEYLESELARVLELCKAANCDAMGFGRDVSKKFNSVDDWESYNWKNRYKKIIAEFSIELILDDDYIIKQSK